MCDEHILGITLWNAQGLTTQSIDFTMQQLNMNTQLFFITETWLLSPRKLKTLWKQHHNYGRQVQNAYRGEFGISLLIHPDFPYTVITDTPTTHYSLTCRINNYIIICFYLPPSLSHTEFMQHIHNEIEKHDPLTNNIILCGDFNARMGTYLHDKNTYNNRYVPFRNFIAQQGLTLWNRELALGIPTYLKGSSNSDTEHSSIIDFFLTMDDQTTFGNPYMEINVDSSLGSDHKLVFFSFIHSLPPPPLISLHPRKLWNINKFKIMPPIPSEEDVDSGNNNNTLENKYITLYRNTITKKLPDIQLSLTKSTLTQCLQQPIFKSNWTTFLIYSVHIYMTPLINQ